MVEIIKDLLEILVLVLTVITLIQKLENNNTKKS